MSLYKYYGIDIDVPGENPTSNVADLIQLSEEVDIHVSPDLVGLDITCADNIVEENVVDKGIPGTQVDVLVGTVEENISPTTSDLVGIDITCTGSIEIHTIVENIPDTQQVNDLLVGIVEETVLPISSIDEITPVIRLDPFTTTMVDHDYAHGVMLDVIPTTSDTSVSSYQDISSISFEQSHQPSASIPWTVPAIPVQMPLEKKSKKSAKEVYGARSNKKR